MPNCFTLDCTLSADWDPGNKRIRFKNSLSLINATTKGAKSDIRSYADGTIVLGSLNQLTSATAGFVLADQEKLIAIAGVGPSGTTLVTTIQTYVSSTTVTLATAASFEGSGKTFYFATDNKTVLQNAITDASALSTAEGGIVTLDNGQYACSGPLSFTGKSGIWLRGSGIEHSGAKPGTQIWLFQQSSGNLLESSETTGVTISNITLYSIGTGWTGALIRPETASSPSVPSTQWFIEQCFFQSANTSGAKLLDLTRARSISIRDCAFQGGSVQIYGGTDSSNVMVEMCTFNECGSFAIKDPARAWTVRSSNFEPNAVKGAAGIECTTDVEGLSIISCWCGDNELTGVAQVWFSLRGSAITLMGNYIGSWKNADVTGVKFTSASSGIWLVGNNFYMDSVPPDTPWTLTTGIDFGSVAISNIDCFTNYISAATKIRNASAIGGGSGIRSAPGARVWRDSPDSIGSGTPGKITFNSSSGTGCFNRGSVWTSGTNGSRFTVPSGCAGIWKIEGQIGWPAGTAGTFRTILIKKNNSDYIARIQQTPASVAKVQNVSCLDNASDNDYYEIFAYHDAGTSQSTLDSDSGMTFGAAVRIA